MLGTRPGRLLGEFVRPRRDEGAAEARAHHPDLGRRPQRARVPAGAERGDGFHAIGLDPEGAARVVERVRRDHPEESFTISLRTGWDPQGMEPDGIRREYDAFEGRRHPARGERAVAQRLDELDALDGVVGRARVGPAVGSAGGRGRGHRHRGLHRVAGV